jgi:hypothetical protein
MSAPPQVIATNSDTNLLANKMGFQQQQQNMSVSAANVFRDFAVRS